MIPSYSFQNPRAFPMACATFETTAQKTLGTLACRDIWWSSFRWNASFLSPHCSTLIGRRVLSAGDSSSQPDSRSREQGSDIAVENWVSEFRPCPRFGHLPYQPGTSNGLLISHSCVNIPKALYLYLYTALTNIPIQDSHRK